jgi:hypothetical protein
MAGKTSGDSSPGVSGIIFFGIQDSFTTHRPRQIAPGHASWHDSPPRAQISHSGANPFLFYALNRSGRAKSLVPDRLKSPDGVVMPYALFCNEAKLSKAYPTEADVWKIAQRSGLVVDASTNEAKPAPRPILDNDYEIRPCRADPQEDPEQNRADAEREAQIAPRLDT